MSHAKKSIFSLWFVLFGKKIKLIIIIINKKKENKKTQLDLYCDFNSPTYHPINSSVIVNINKH